jgi:Bifunctional DNA primase/polymerase, N-terminal
MTDAEPPGGRPGGSKVHDQTGAQSNAWVRQGLGSYALGLAGADLPVLPLLPRDKRPRFKRSFHHATCDAERIEKHWYYHPGDNIGVRPPLGMAVLDIDPRHGGRSTMARLLAEHGPLPQTWTARTGSDGRHLWFVVGQIPLRGSLGRDSGVDIKHGGTGFVVAPPSIHPNGSRYEWLTPPLGDPATAPGWLLRLLRPPVYTPPPAGARDRAQHSAHKLVRRIEAAPQGRRHVTVYGALRDAFKQGELDALQDALTAAAMATGLPDAEVAAIVRDVRAGG